MSTDAAADPPAAVDSDPLADLPRVSAREIRLQSLLARPRVGRRIRAALAWLTAPLGTSLVLLQPEILWRAAGWKRPGVVAQLSWPRQSTRLGLALDTPLAHALVDRLLGFERRPGEDRLQCTPVEWGILTFAIARTLADLAADEESQTWDLILDRVGPEPFNSDGLGRIVTLRWPVEVSGITGSVRVWIPESILAPALSASDQKSPVMDASALGERYGELAGLWRVEAGTVRLPLGLARLRVGGIVPLDRGPIGSSANRPAGTLDLALALRDRESRSWFSVELLASSGGARLTLTTPLQRSPAPREAIPVPPSSAPTGNVSPAHVPVTLTVELGRVSIPLHRLADLKPGDVIELGRHSREPVELTSAGRLIARGDLVQVDSELGVRVTNVFM